MNAPATISPTDIRLAQDQVRAVAAMLAEDGDEQLKLDTLEGETNLFELIRALLDAVETDEGNVADLKIQIDHRNSRKAAAEHRNDQRRKAIVLLLGLAKLDTIRLPEATISVRSVPPKLLVTDEAAVPEGFCRIQRTPDMAAIKAEVEAGRAVSGVTLGNGSISLTIRRK